MRSAFFHIPTHISLAVRPFIFSRYGLSLRRKRHRHAAEVDLEFFFLFFALFFCIAASIWFFLLIFPCHPSRLSLRSPAPALSICWSLEGAENKLGTAYLVIENSPYASFRPLCCCEGCECAVGGEGAPTLNWKIYDTTKAAQEKGSKREKSLNGTRENIENPCSGRREIESQEKQRQHWENISVSLNGVIFQHWWKC